MKKSWEPDFVLWLFTTQHTYIFKNCLYFFRMVLGSQLKGKENHRSPHIAKKYFREQSVAVRLLRIKQYPRTGFLDPSCFHPPLGGSMIETLILR